MIRKYRNRLIAGSSVFTLMLVLLLAGLSGSSALATDSPSHFLVSHDGSAYRAESSDTVYTGSLKTVVESAVAHLNGMGGGTVEFTAGDFNLGSDWFRLVEIHNITIEGQGIDVTTIRNYTTIAQDTEPFNFKGTYYVVIRDMTVSAGGTVRNTSDALDFDKGNNSTVERVKITAARGKGIIFDGKNIESNGTPWTSQGNVVRDCIISGTSGDGVQFLASSNNRVEGCTIHDVGKDGIRATKSQFDAQQPNKKANNNVITGNTIDNAGYNGIEVNSSDGNEITGNVVTNSSDDRSGFDGIRIGSMDSITCNDNRVESNTATDNQAVKTQEYGLNITSALCNRTFVGTNDFSGNRSGAIRDRGTNTQYGSSDNQAPSRPMGLTATPITPGRIDLSWSPSSDNVGVTGYTIYRDSVPLATVGGSTTTYQDTTVVPSTTYSYTVDAFDAAGNHSLQSDPAVATAPADTTPPSAPTLLHTTAVGASEVDLAWTASSDNVGVDHYDVRRGGSSIGTTTNTSFADTTVQPNTTYTYTVVAYDRAGNYSGPSNSVTVTTPAAVTTLTFTPSADAYVRPDQPTSNFGNASSIQVDNSPVKNFLLKFTVSGVGGRPITSAKLRLYCVDPSDRGGDFHPLADPNAVWSEQTVTWNNAPAASSATTASMGGVTAGTWYEVDVSSFVTGDGTYSLRTTTPSSNGADYSSKEGANPPQLVLTLG
jgi:parallel beta-helix repeat protein